MANPSGLLNISTLFHLLDRSYLNPNKKCNKFKDIDQNGLYIGRVFE